MPVKMVVDRSTHLDAKQLGQQVCGTRNTRETAVVADRVGQLVVLADDRRRLGLRRCDLANNVRDSPSHCDSCEGFLGLKGEREAYRTVYSAQRKRKLFVKGQTMAKRMLLEFVWIKQKAVFSLLCSKDSIERGGYIRRKTAKENHVFYRTPVTAKRIRNSKHHEREWRALCIIGKTAEVLASAFIDERFIYQITKMNTKETFCAPVHNNSITGCEIVQKSDRQISTIGFHEQRSIVLSTSVKVVLYIDIVLFTVFP